LNNPTIFADPLGLQVDSGVLNAVLPGLAKSYAGTRVSNTEYAGSVITTGSGMQTLPPQTLGSSTASSFSQSYGSYHGGINAIINALSNYPDLVATYHSHTRLNGYDASIFSLPDVVAAQGLGKPSFIIDSETGHV